MSTREELEKRSLSEPSERSVIGALADWRMEYLGEGRFTALRNAVKPRRDRRNELECAEAAELLRSEQPLGQILRSLLADAVQLGLTAHLTINVVPGRRWPQLVLRQRRISRSLILPPEVAVGARWVLQLRKRPRPGRRVSRRAIDSYRNN